MVRTSTNDSLDVNPWAGLRAGYAITFTVHDSDGIYITVNSSAAPFECFFDSATFHEFLIRAEAALADMDAWAAKEAAERTNRRCCERNNAHE